MVYDSSFLSEERRKYLDQAVDIQDHLRGYEEYATQAHTYIKQKEWTSMRLKYLDHQLEDAITEFTIKSLSSVTKLENKANEETESKMNDDSE